MRYGAILSLEQFERMLSLTVNKYNGNPASLGPRQDEAMFKARFPWDQVSLLVGNQHEILISPLA